MSLAARHRGNCGDDSDRVAPRSTIQCCTSRREFLRKETFVASVLSPTLPTPLYFVRSCLTFGETRWLQSSAPPKPPRGCHHRQQTRRERRAAARVTPRSRREYDLRFSTSNGNSRNRSVAVKRFAQLSSASCDRDFGGRLLRCPCKRVFMAAISAEDTGSSRDTATLLGTRCKSDRIQLWRSPSS